MKKNLFFTLAGTLFCGAVLAQSGTPTYNGAALKTNIDSVSYSIGVDIAQGLKSEGLSDVNPALLGQAIKDSFSGQPLAIDEAKTRGVIMEYIQKQRQKKAEGAKKKGLDFLEANKKDPEVVALPSGLQYKIIKAGNGAKPTVNDKVTTHYHGTLIDGTVFDSSVQRGEPVTFSVGGVIKGWTEALQLMSVGSKWKLYIPSDLAYGDNGAGGKIGPGEVLIFDVELLKIEAAEAAPAAPAKPAAKPEVKPAPKGKK